MIEKVGDQYKLIVIIVKKDLSRRIIRACKKAGAEGGTVFQARGSGKHEKESILGVRIEPEKEVVLCLAENMLVDRVLSKITAAARLDRPGTGIAFVLNSRSVTGIAHLLPKDF